MIRAVVDGLGMATRDCYAAMGSMPAELRLTGGAARSAALRKVLAVRWTLPSACPHRDEAGAAGCAMMAAVAIGAYADMDACIAEWIDAAFGRRPSRADPTLVPVYDTAISKPTAPRASVGPRLGQPGCTAPRSRSNT